MNGIAPLLLGYSAMLAAGFRGEFDGAGSVGS
jgi:hypothetical protein